MCGIGWSKLLKFELAEYHYKIVDDLLLDTMIKFLVLELVHLGSKFSTTQMFAFFWIYFRCLEVVLLVMNRLYCSWCPLFVSVWTLEEEEKAG